MNTAEEVRSILKSVKNLLQHGWTREADAKDGRGKAVDPCSPHAVRWSLKGAVRRALVLNGTLSSLFLAQDVLEQLDFGKAKDRITRYNDEHSQEEIIAMIDEAIGRVK